MTKPDNTIALTDERGNTVLIDPAAVKFAACWDNGQLNIFFNDEDTPAAMLMFKAGDEQNQLDVLADAIRRSGIETFALENSDTDGSRSYTFLYRPGLVRFYKDHADAINPPRNGRSPLVVEDVPFYVDEATKARFRAAVENNRPGDWLVFTPDAPWPLTSEGGTFAVRKAGAGMVTGYLIGNVIIDMRDRARLFIKVAEDPARRQADEVGRLFDGFVTVQGPQSAARFHPDYFDEESTFIREFDFGGGKKNALLIQEESWHVPFYTVADAEAALAKLKADVAAASARPSGGPGPLPPRP